MAVLLEEIVQSVEMWLSLLRRQKAEQYVDPDLDPVLLVPGIAGSIMKAVDSGNGKEERVWVRILGADYKCRSKLWSRYDPSTGNNLYIILSLNVFIYLHRLMYFSLFVDSDVGISSSDKLNFTRPRNPKLNVVKIHDFHNILC